MIIVWRGAPLKAQFLSTATAGAGELFCDGLHPNVKGHRVIAENLMDYLNEKNFANKQ